MNVSTEYMRSSTSIPLSDQTSIPKLVTFAAGKLEVYKTHHALPISTLTSTPTSLTHDFYLNRMKYTTIATLVAVLATISVQALPAKVTPTPSMMLFAKRDEENVSNMI
jgi:hypothetical protein